MTCVQKARILHKIYLKSNLRLSDVRRRWHLLCNSLGQNEVNMSTAPKQKQFKAIMLSLTATFLLQSNFAVAENLNPLSFFNNISLAGNIAMKDVLKFVKSNCEGLEKVADLNNLSPELHNACLLPSLFSFYYSHEEILKDKRTAPLHLPRKWQAQHVIAGIWNDQYFRSIEAGQIKNKASSCEESQHKDLEVLSANSCLSQLFSKKATHCTNLVKNCYAKNPKFYADEFVANYLLTRIAVTKSLNAVREVLLNQWKAQPAAAFQRAIFPAASSYFNGANDLSTMQEYYFAIQCKIEDQNCKKQKSKIGTILFKNLQNSKNEFEKTYDAITQASSNHEVKIPTMNRLLEKMEIYQEVVDSDSTAMEMMESVLNYTGQLGKSHTILKKIFSMENGHNDFPIFSREAVKSHYAMVQFLDWYRSYHQFNLLQYDQMPEVSEEMDQSEDYQAIAKRIRKHIFKQSSSLFRYLEEQIGGPQ